MPPAPPPRPLRFGVVVRAGASAGGDLARAAATTRRRLNAACRALKQSLGYDVRGRIAPDYPALLSAIGGGEVELAWLPPVVALQAGAARIARPIAMPVRGGVATFHTALFARADSPLRSTADLKGVRAAWVDRQSASGYLVIRGALRSQGVHLDQAFSEEHVVGSHAAVVAAVREGQVDVGATFIREEPDGHWTGNWGDLAAQVIARVGPIPNDVIAAGVHLPMQLEARVRHALLAEGTTQTSAATLLEADRLVPADDSHLEALTRLLSHLDTPLPTNRRSSSTLKRVR